MLVLLCPQCIDEESKEQGSDMLQLQGGTCLLFNLLLKNSLCFEIQKKKNCIQILFSADSGSCSVATLLLWFRIIMHEVYEKVKEAALRSSRPVSTSNIRRCHVTLAELPCSPLAV